MLPPCIHVFVATFAHGQQQTPFYSYSHATWAMKNLLKALATE